MFCVGSEICNLNNVSAVPGLIPRHRQVLYSYVLPSCFIGKLVFCTFCNEYLINYYCCLAVIFVCAVGGTYIQVMNVVLMHKVMVYKNMLHGTPYNIVSASAKKKGC